MINAAAHEWVRYQQACFNRSITCFDEADATYAPVDGMFTVANHVAHAADIVQWLCDGAFTANSFDTDLVARERRIRRFDAATIAHRVSPPPSPTSGCTPEPSRPTWSWARWP
jgi:hypothetical protein